MKVRFLLDENLSPRLSAGLWRHNPAIDVLRVGDPGAPLLGAPDPDILHYLQQEQRTLVTNNRISMPTHLREHAVAGGHQWGIFWLRPGISLGAILAELVLIWEASEAEEWRDRTRWIPL